MFIRAKSGQAPFKILNHSVSKSESPRNYSKALNMAVLKMKEHEIIDFEAPWNWFGLDDNSISPTLGFVYKHKTSLFSGICRELFRNIFESANYNIYGIGRASA